MRENRLSGSMQGWREENSGNCQLRSVQSLLSSPTYSTGDCGNWSSRLHYLAVRLRRNDLARERGRG